MVTYKALPETPFADKAGVGKCLELLYAEEIVGFVMRGAWLQHRIGHEPELGISSEVVALGGCLTVMTRDMGFGVTSDYGRHTDPEHELVGPDTQVVNLNTNKYGVSGFTIFGKTAAYSARILAGDTTALLDYRTPHDVITLSHTRQYSSGLYLAYPQIY